MSEGRGTQSCRPALAVRRRNLEDFEPIGLRECSHHLLRCSACGEDLLDVMVTNPEYDGTLRYRADCPHCGDHSFPTPPIKGGTCIGILADTQDQARTLYVGATDKGDIVYLHTKKGPAAL